MGQTTGISWTDATFNPWIGCTKVSAGCTNCYAERDNERYKWVDEWGVQGTRKRTSVSTWQNPIKWNHKAARDGKRLKVFCASLADVFEDRRELDSCRTDLFDMIFDTPNLDWLILTKRPENWDQLTAEYREYTQFPWSNIWLGVTVENQEMANKRIPLLLQIPARVRFVSVEPMLGMVSVCGGDPVGRVPNWVICGGESGKNARPMEEWWARDLRDQCKAFGVPFFMKQMGGWPNTRHELADFPADLRVREFPNP